MMAAHVVDEAIVVAVTACDRFGAEYDQSVIERVRCKIEEHANKLGQSAGAPC